MKTLWNGWFRRPNDAVAAEVLLEGDQNMGTLMQKYEAALKRKKRVFRMLQIAVLLFAAALLVGLVVFLWPASAGAGNIASIKASAVADSVKSGDLISFQFTATYASAQASGEEHRMPDAFFALQFSTSPDDLQCVYTPGVRPDDTDTDWQKIRQYLQSHPDLPYAQAEDWEKIDLNEGAFCYYSSSHQIGLLHVEPGASIAQKTMKFRFPNGVTPDGARLTLTPQILNRDEIETSYRELRREAGMSDEEIDTELETAFLKTDPASVVNTASFDWKPVVKTADQGLGNIVKQEGVPGILTFTIQTQPSAKADESSGVLYTRNYTLRDSLILEGGLYYNITGRTWSVATVANATEFLVDEEPLLVVNRPDLRIDPIWADTPGGESDDGQYIMGFRFSYTCENESLTGETPAEAEELDLRVQLLQVKQIRFDKYNRDAFGIRNTVDFDAYSIMGDDADPVETGDVKYRHVQSSDSVFLDEIADYPLGKEAFHQYENGVLSEPANDSASYFQPGETVYYKITVHNDGSANRFIVQDQLPAGLENIQLLKVRKNGAEVTDWDSKFSISEDGSSFTYLTNQIIAGEYGEFIFSADIKSKSELTALGSSALKNTAKWYFQDAPTTILDSGACTINVNLGITEAGSLNIQKSSSAADNMMTFGQLVTYTIRLTNSSKTDQFVTVTDFWPDGLLLKRFETLPPGGTIQLLNEEGEELYTYTNTTNGNQARDLGQAVAANTDRVKFTNIRVPARSEWKLVLKGTVGMTGSVTNRAEVDTGNGDNPSSQVTNNALALSIEKVAMRIKGADANVGNWSAAENVNANGSSPLFVADDVVCYDVRVKNNDAKTQTGITLTDTLPATLRNALNVTGQTLSPADSSIQVLRRQGNGAFLPVANAVFSKGVLTIADLEIPAGRTDTFRFYLRIPQSAVHGDGSAATHINQAQASILHNGQKLTITASCPIITQIPTGQTANVEKSIVFTAKTYKSGSNQVTGAVVPKSGEIPVVSQGDYVFYRLAITNTSKTALKIWELKDWLPEGMTFVAATNYDGLTELVKKLKPNGNSSCGAHFVQLKLDGTASSALMLQSVKPDGTRVGGAAQKSLFVNSVENTCTFSNGKQAWSLPAGYTLPLGIMVQVTDGGVLADPALNKMGAKVLSSVDVTPGDTITRAEHIDNTYQYLTDTAPVRAAPYTPGISKELYQYQEAGKWEPYEAEDASVISPSSSLRWRLELQNGTNGTQTCGDIRVYTVTDTLPPGFAYQGGSLLVDSSGASCRLPDPVLSKNGDGQNVLTWRFGDADGDGSISGDEISLSDFSYFLPAGGSLFLQFETKWDVEYSASAKYGTYINRADLTPGSQYEFTQACAGELDNKDHPTAVWAVKQLDLIGGGQTKSWKTVTNQKGETARGDTPQNNRVTAMPGESLLYTLNIESQIQNGKVQDLVIIDRLPTAGDTGVTNRIPRQSDFLLRFADDPQITVTRTFADGQITVLEEGKDYFIQFGKWAELTAESGGLLRTEDWRVMSETGSGRLRTDGTRWVNKADITDFSEFDCIRVQRVSDPDVSVEQQKGTVLSVSFRTHIPEDSSVYAGDIAWNSFGYSYNISNHQELGWITVEPPRVGVQIPSAQLKVTKLLQEGNHDDQPFAFLLEQSADGENWFPAAGVTYIVGSGAALKTNADGGFELARDQTAVFSVLPGYYYRVTETETPGYGRPTVTAADVPGGQLAVVSGTVFTAVPTSVFTPGVTFVNHKGLQMAETGGSGIWPFLLGGSLLIAAGAVLALLAYRRSKK